MSYLKVTVALCLASLGTGCTNPGVPSLTSSSGGASSSSSAGLAKDDLVYVTNQNAEVTVYNLATAQLVGVLTRFTEPMGECVDAGGNVYIADESAQTIVEYAHGGKKPVKTFDDSPDSPRTCAIDPKTGNLAVANKDDVAIWSKGSSEPTRYTDSSLDGFIGCAYDDNGNLLVSDYSTFAWLPRAGSKLVDLVIPGPKSGWRWGISGIQWDGRFFVLDGRITAYRITVLHGLAYYVGDTRLYHASSYSSSSSSNYDIVYGPYWIFRPSSTSQNAQILTPICDQFGCPSVESFKYPSGDGPVFKFTHGLDGPIDVAVSPKTN
jgi:hypothetical protein